MTQPQIGCYFQAQTTTVTTAGTRVQISASPEHVRRITFKAPSGNTGDIYVGGSDVSSTTGWTLPPGESVPLDFDPQTEELSSFYLDAANNGDKVEWIIGASSAAGQLAAGHVIGAHTDTGASGAELTTLTDSSSTALHNHTHANTTGLGTDDHHAQAHTVPSHSDTTATGAELETLTDGSSTTLHTHAHSASVGITDHHGMAFARKTSDETETNSDTFQDDDDLYFAVGANETWLVMYMLRVTGTSSTGDIKIKHTGPTGATLPNRSKEGPFCWMGNPAGETGGAAMGSINTGFTDVNANRIFGLPNTVNTESSLILWSWIVNGSTPGNLTLQWAQNVAHGGITRIKAGSTLIAWQVA